MEGLPVYLVDASFAFPKEGAGPNQHPSPERTRGNGTAQRHSSRLFREILVSKFHFEPDFVDGKIGDMKRDPQVSKARPWAPEPCC